MTPVAPPRYFWLWHLAAMGVIDARFGPPDDPVAGPMSARLEEVTGSRWDEIASGPPATVALIDTGTSRRHPNLAGRIDTKLSIDLTSHRYGAQHDGTMPPPAPREKAQAFFGKLEPSLSKLDLSKMPDEDLKFLKAMVAEYSGSTGVVRYLAEPEELIGAHGTACAGLLVGHPGLVAGQGPVRIGGAGASANPNVLPYFGVDPWSRLISIRTGFDEDALQFIAAFLYALACGVHAIVLPRGLPDPRLSRLDPLPEFAAPGEGWNTRATDYLIARRGVAAEGRDPTASETSNGYEPERPWNVLRAVVIAVSKEIPIFCAAGNDGESQLIYPANLAASDNGIVAVGAVTPEGYRAGYSNYGEKLTLVMPSDDYEVLNRHQARIDRTDPMVGMHDFDAIGAATTVPYCPLELITTDLPGAFGYDRGEAPWSALADPQTNPGIGGGYYTAFGGTSGACCLAGGLALLAQRARLATGTALKGVAMKDALIGSARLDTHVQPGTAPLRGDRINWHKKDEEETEPLKRFFGAGLPHAGRLLDEVRKLP
jgi:subtilisin family serine protease